MFKKLHLLILFTLLTSVNGYSQLTKVQIINNIADVSNMAVDVWINNAKAFPDMFFRTSTAYTSYTTTAPFTIAIAAQGSGIINDTFYSKTITLSPANEYIIVLNGLRTSTGYTPFKPISADVYANAKGVAAGGTDLLFGNMATDAPFYDFRSGIKTVGNNLGYGAFSSGYSSFGSVLTKIRTTNDNGDIRYNTYEADLSDLSLANKACVVISSGFANPSSNNNGPSLGLWMSIPDGGSLIELKTTAPEAIARVQFIHNCADTTGDTVDVYAGTQKVIDDFTFHTATAFVEYHGNVPTTFGVAPRNSTSSANATYTQTITFDSLGTHVVVANGILSTAGYTPLTPFRLTKYNGAREKPVNDANHDVLFCNASTDATNLTVNASSGAWYSNVAFDNFASYQSVPATASTVLGLNGTSGTYGSFLTNFPAQGEALTLVATGFADSIKNSKGPKLHLYYARPAGGALTRLPIYTMSVNEVDDLNTLNIYPNPVNTTLYINSKIPMQSISIINSIGIEVNNIKAPKGSVDVSNLPAGVYIAEGQTTNGKITQRFIKQ